jgi:DNA-3-methyladenine glycosylase
VTREPRRPPERLPRAFFERDAATVARELLGKVLVRGRWAGRIVEAEGYHGFDDRASHAHRGRTARNAIMFGAAGFAYVYQIYGMYFCLNVTTATVDLPSAVLIRAVAPIDGRPFPSDDARAGAGPGKLCAALGIDKGDYGVDLVEGSRLWIGEDGSAVGEIGVGPRVGVDYAGEWAATPWRFWLAGNAAVSRTPRAVAVKAPRTAARLAPRRRRA